jgi:hypothetical protein
MPTTKLKEIQQVPDWAFHISVKDCKNVYEFAYKYRKSDRFTQRGNEYVKATMDSHLKDIEDKGYTNISCHDNVTGKHIVFIP